MEALKTLRLITSVSWRWACEGAGQSILEEEEEEEEEEGVELLHFLSNCPQS